MPSQMKERTAKNMKFSEKIIQARKAKALTQEDLAEAVGVSRQAVSKWETEEAKPDLDKLVSICKVLDLSMDYLCLNKEPVTTTEQPAEPSPICRKRYMLMGLLIGLAVAVLSVCVCIGLLWTPADSADSNMDTVPTSTVAVAPDYMDVLEKLKVSDAKLETPYSKQWRITFMPNIQAPGMEVQIAVRNNLTGSTLYYDTAESGGGYYLDFKRPDNQYNFDFIAVCRIGEVTVQFPLINIEGEGGLYSHDYIWLKR